MDVAQFGGVHLPTILQTAKLHYQRREFGKCCSYYLLLFNYDGNYCNSEKHEFILVFTKWLEKLLLLEKMQEFSTFIQTSLEICMPIRIDIVLAASKTLFQSEYFYEAAKLLASCRTKKITSYALEENIEQLYNILIDRWHYRMLNDKKRNMAYSLALIKAYQRGHRKILDVGSGTGIFSLLACTSGFEAIYSCEASEVMCDIQKKAIHYNGIGSNIQIINKLSTDLEIGKDLQEKPTLIITEVFDCGLLGEGAITILINAWDKLLDNEHGEVIPNSAVVYGVCIECEELRKHNRYEAPNGFMFYGSKDHGDEKHQPYTTEYMAGIRGGYRKLSNSFVVKSFNFNKPGELKDSIGQSHIVEVPIIANGILDAVMVYFTLNVDLSSEINTIDKDGLCWEQAIYNIPFQRDVKLDANLLLEIRCCEEHFKIQIINDKGDPKKCMECQLPSKVQEVNVNDNSICKCNSIYPLDRRLVARLNDNLYVQKYSSAIFHHVNVLKTVYMRELNICFICPEISIFPLLISQLDYHNIYLIDPSDVLIQFLHQKNSSSTKIKSVLRPLFKKLNSSKICFDLVISEAIDTNGLIKENFIEDMTVIRLVSCCNDTVYIPSNIDVYGYFVSSDHLLNKNRVLDDNIPLNLNIEEFINEYKVTTHPDVDGNSFLDYLLTDGCSFGCICINKLGKDELESSHFDQRNVDICFTRSGMLTGLVYWFDIALSEGENISTSPSNITHWHQACVVFPDQKYVHVGDKLTLSVTRNKSNFHFEKYSCV